jgi:hypothetical protein
MAQENFNVSQPNDGLGDKLRSAFIKVQSNFTDLFTEKVDKEVGKGLSSNDYTTTQKNKLANIEDFAELNVQSDFLQNDDTQDDFIKNKPAIPVVADYLLNGGYAGTAQDLDDAIESGGQLVKITENGKTGYRLKDADPANYGNIGDNAVDLSFQIDESTTNGATGNNSHAQGADTTASGDISHAEGELTTASGNNSHAEGNGTNASGNNSHTEGNNTAASADESHAEGNATTASGRASHAEGSNAVASGSSSHVEGTQTFSRSFGEHSGGVNGTDYTPQNATGFDLTDRLVNYGNGVNTSNRSDAYTLFKNGMQKFFTAALSTITNAVKGSVMLDENARLNIHDGTAFKAVAFSDEVATLAQGVKADNSVQLTGAQTVAGVKTFSDNIIANGNFGINQQTPTEKLDVVGNGKFSGSITSGADIVANGLTVGRGGGNISTNTANGQNALRSNTTGSNNTANGLNSLYNNTIGSSNTANGVSALFANTTATGNTGNGKDSLLLNTTGSFNTASGTSSLRNNTTGNDNNGYGLSALLSNTTGSNNFAGGANSGRFIQNGTTENTITNNSVFLGGNTKALADNQTNQIVIGHNAIGAGSNTVTLGNTTITNTILRGAVSFAQFTTATEPAYLKGGQFFNTTLNKMRIGGATAYETVTSS